LLRLRITEVFKRWDREQTAVKTNTSKDYAIYSIGTRRRARNGKKEFTEQRKACRSSKNLV